MGQGPPHPPRRSYVDAGAPGRSRDPRARPTRSPRSTSATSARRSGRAWSTSTTSSRPAPTRSRPTPQFAATQRWRFRHLFVDEFQDVTPAQLAPAAGPGSATAPTCASSATPTRRSTRSPAPTRGLLTRFARRSFEGAAVVRLDVNYRSTPGDREGRPRGAARARAGRRARRRRSTGPSPTVTAYATDAAEARRRRRRAPRARTGATRPWSRMAVLYRVNAQSALFEEALRRAGIPYRVRGAARLPRPARGEGRASTRCGHEREGGAGPRVRRAPHRSRRPTRGTCPRTGGSTSTRSPRSAASTSRPRAAPARSTGSSSTCRASLRGGDDGGLHGRRGRPAHVPPGQGPRVGHRVRHRARARARPDLARDRQRPTRSTRSVACSTSRSAAPSASCTCRWAKERARGEPRVERGRRARTSARSSATIAGGAGRPAGAAAATPGRGRRHAGARGRSDGGELAVDGPPALRRRSSPGGASWPGPRRCRRT